MCEAHDLISQAKRKRPRAKAAIVAALLAATVLSAISAAPANAANTSGEELLDTNDDGIGDTREFGGTHRYNTAVALAQRFAADQPHISTVIIASGETQVDAVAAAGLAGFLKVPILLTRDYQLPHNVRRYIEQHSITKVIIVGGTDVVPNAIKTAIEALDTTPTVERISGPDRYATAAAISKRIGGPKPRWCGTTQVSAVLVNGTEAGQADAIAIGPLAYGLKMPILLTEADRLPSVTRAYLTDNNIQHVVVVGNDTTVSERIRTSLVEDIGVVSTRRIAGGTAAATSVAIAQEMLGNCADLLGANPDMVALVNRDASSDGIAAAPVLGRGLGNSGPVPVLLVGPRLPTEVSDYLESTPEFRPGHGDTHMSILAIGGTAVVSNAVMAQAIAAARTTAGLTAVIHVRVDPFTGKYETHTTGGITGGVFTVTFSSEVERPIAGGPVSGTVLDPLMYRINGRRLAGFPPGGTSDEPVEIVDRIYIEDRTVTVKLSHILEPGDTITVVGGARVGAHDDLRRLEGTSLTLARLADSTHQSAPRVDILAVAGLSEFKVFVTEPDLFYNQLISPRWDDFIKINGKGARVVDITGRPSVVFGEPGRHLATDEILVTTSSRLVAGDVISVGRQAVLDSNSVGNAPRSLIVPNPKGPGSFAVADVYVGRQDHTLRQATTTVETADVVPIAKMQLIARPTGPAAGAKGNEWSIIGYDNRPGADGAAKAASTNAFSIQVIADAVTKDIVYVISETTPVRDIGRQANLLDLASALHADRTVASSFVIDYVRAADGVTKANQNDTKATPLGATDPAGVEFSGGVSAAAVNVKFNDAVQSLTESQPGTFDVVTDLVPSGATGYVSSSRFSSLSDEVFITYWVSDIDALPARSIFRIIQADIATNYFNTANTDLSTLEGTGNARRVLNSLRLDTSLKPLERTRAQLAVIVGELFP